MSAIGVRRAAIGLYSWLMKLRFIRFRTIEWGRRVVIKGMPLIDVRDGGRVAIGDDVTLNSRNRGYHVNMHSPVKLVADKPGATIRIGASTRVHGSCIHAYSEITIGASCLIAANCQIIDGSGHEMGFEDLERRMQTSARGLPIVIEDHVWIGANCIVLPGVRIGRGAVVGAGSVVTKDVPPMAVAAGNPARVVRQFEDPTAPPK